MKIFEEIKNEENKRMRERIRSFDKEMLSYQANGLPPEWGKGLWGFLSVFMMVFPMQYSLDGITSILMFQIMWGMYAPFSYLAIYNNIRENRKSVSVYQKIKYLPVDIRQLRLVRIGYLFDFLKKTLTISVILQVLSTLLFYRTCSVWNIVYVFTVNGILPAVLITSSIWFMRSGK